MCVDVCVCVVCEPFPNLLPHTSPFRLKIEFILYGGGALTWTMVFGREGPTLLDEVCAAPGVRCPQLEVKQVRWSSWAAVQLGP